MNLTPVAAQTLKDHVNVVRWFPAVSCTVLVILAVYVFPCLSLDPGVNVALRWSLATFTAAASFEARPTWWSWNVDVVTPATFSLNVTVTRDVGLPNEFGVQRSRSASWHRP